ncbi:hypothetical protein NBT05_06180 [Aquimarina sp. ERC-38]|uniref:hypothetical protein n=1 Tax=Aquimarina sp. ERC-38 TaxID=2949996 RepID=UPI002246D63D|nr:hypothetical protein [Aquimarina sp. ERC-38]UZO82055.1 hypothetical protein NBT05_06180 [Aquimarina sp. ERC-38]
MILETTHYNKDHKKTIDSMVGSSFSFMERLKMGGIGSKRMIINEVSPNMKSFLNSVSDINYGNIELRPYGILVAITKGLRNFTWIVPYYQFYMYNVNGISIHAQGRFVHFKDSKMFKENHSFFEKLKKLKIAYDIEHPHIDSI